MDLKESQSLGYTNDGSLLVASRVTPGYMGVVVTGYGSPFLYCLLSLTALAIHQVPWIIDPTGSSDIILRHFISLKLSLMPYLYWTAISTHKTGNPMMRPLFFEYPEDRTSWTVDEAYMLGENLYVAPVFSGSDSDPMGSGGYSAAGSSFAPDNSGLTKGSSTGYATAVGKASVQVYIPPGDWFSLLTGEFFTGPSWSIQHHAYDTVPLLLRPGRAIILSGGAPVDFYFDESGAWKLRDLSEMKVDERAWRGDGEFKARGAEYDYTTRVTVVINVSRPPPSPLGSTEHQATSLDLKLFVPDNRDERLGESCAELRVWENESGKVSVEVVRGELKGEWRVVKVGKGAGVVQGVAREGQKLLEV